MWIQLLVCKQVTIKGTRTNCQPGDYVEVGKHDARRWIAAGEAIVPAQRLAEVLPGDAGVVLPANSKRLQALVAFYGDVLAFEVRRKPELVFGKTLIWDGAVNLQKELILTGLGLLGRWQVAVPLLDYRLLACSIGDEDDRARTAAVLPDLRVPVYDSRAVFVNRCPDTRRLIEMWNEDPGANRDLAFLRALYLTKPLVLALPATWTGNVAEA